MEPTKKYALIAGLVGSFGALGFLTYRKIQELKGMGAAMQAGASVAEGQQDYLTQQATRIQTLLAARAETYGAEVAEQAAKQMLASYGLTERRMRGISTLVERSRAITGGISVLFSR